MILYNVSAVKAYLEKCGYSDTAKYLKLATRKLGKYNEYISKAELYSIVGYDMGRFISAGVIAVMDNASAQAIYKSFK